MNPIDWIGTYAERGQGRDSDGNAGTLNGRVSVHATDESLTFAYDDGHSITTGALAGGSAPVAGQGGGSTSTGTIYLGNGSEMLRD